MLLVGLVLCLLVGVEAGGMAAGAFHMDAGRGVVFFVVGINLVPWTGLSAGAVMAAASRRKERGGVAPVRVPALARVETVRASGEGATLTLHLDLTVAPDGLPAYRVNTLTTANVMDLDAYRVDRILVVDVDPAYPWEVKVDHRPALEWSSRATLAKLDSAPEVSRAVRPQAVRRKVGRFGWWAVLVGFLVTFVPLWTSWH